MTENQYSPENYTGSTQFAHLHAHSIYSSLDGVASIQEYAEECVKRGWPGMAITEHGHMGSVPDLYFTFKEHGLKPIPGCFLFDQPVVTDSGIKSLGSLGPNDKVLTHKNRFRNVKNLQIRTYDGLLTRIKCWGVEDILCTPEHPFLVREVTRSEIKKSVWEDRIDIGWRKASDLFREKYHRTYSTKKSKNRNNKRKFRFYLCVPRPNGNGIKHVDISNHCFLDNHELSINNGVIESVKYIDRNSQNVGIPAQLELCPDLLWIMGLWIAKGTFKDGLSFHLGLDEYHFYERISDYFSQFGIKVTANPRNSESEKTPRQALDVNVYSTFFGRLFVSLFGVHFDKKRIPNDWLFNLSRKQSSHLLDGIYDGDAKICVDQSNLKLCNETLVWQIRILLSAIGQYSAITKVPNNNSENIGYNVRRRESGHFYYDLDDDYIYLPVYAIEHEPYTGYVYNIEVDQDNSYNVGVACHNCEIYYNDYEPKRKQLAESGVKFKSQAWRAENVELAQRINRNRHLTVLCKNQTGFENLLKLTTEAYRDGLYGAGTTQYNRIWFEKLCERKEGLIILSGCLNGPVSFELRNKEVKDREGNIIKEYSLSERLDAAVKYVKKFKEVFGEDYYIELQMPGIENDHVVFQQLVSIANHFKIKTVLANDSHYLERRDYDIQTIMMAVAQGVTVDSPDLFHVNSSEQFFKTRAELWSYFMSNKYSQVGLDVFHNSCDNSLEIVDKCQEIVLDSNPKFPRINNDAARLIETATRELKKRGWHLEQRKFNIDGRDVTYKEQMAIELQRFISKGFASYFLITEDIIKYGKSKGYIFGPRGCSVPDGLVRMADGTDKEIVNVTIGDIVLDGFGQEQKVENKFVYDVFEDIIVIECNGQKLKITSDHKLYIIRDGIVMLLKASEIKDGDELIDPSSIRIHNHENKEN